MENYPKISLSIYEITINKKREPHTNYVINDYDNGSDLFDFFKKCMEGWCQRQNSLVADNIAQKVIRLARREDGTTHLIPIGRTLYGLYESGEYGIERDVIDIQTGERQYTQDANHAPILPFYFLFVLNRDCTSGFLILQRFSKYGVYTICEKTFRDAFSFLHENYLLKIKPFSSANIVNQYLAALQLKEIILKDVTYDNISKNTIARSIQTDPTLCELNLCLKAKSRSFIMNRDVLRNRRYVTIEGLNYTDTEFRVKIGDKQRTLTFPQLQEIGTNIDITENVTWGSNRIPTTESIHAEAMQLMSSILEEINQNQ